MSEQTTPLPNTETGGRPALPTESSNGVDARREMKERLGTIAHEARDLPRLAGEATRESLRAGATTARGTLKRTREATRTMVANRPFTFVAVAAGIGAVLGALMGGLRRR